MQLVQLLDKRAQPAHAAQRRSTSQRLELLAIAALVRALEALAQVTLEAEDAREEEGEAQALVEREVVDRVRERDACHRAEVGRERLLEVCGEM